MDGVDGDNDDKNELYAYSVAIRQCDKTEINRGEI
jgi:hypothetical protein